MKAAGKKRPLINNYGSALLGLKQTPDSFKRSLIQHSNDDFIKCLCECCKNVLKGNVRMSDSHKELLGGQSRDIRQLADKTILLKRKRRILTPKLVDLLTEAVKPVIGKI